MEVRLFLTSVYQSDFAIVFAWRHPPIYHRCETKTAALISPSRRLRRDKFVLNDGFFSFAVVRQKLGKCICSVLTPICIVVLLA